MRLAKFIEKLDNNEIDDLTPYIDCNQRARNRPSFKTR